MEGEALRVLVLEDDANMREILCETLEDAGYRVDSAAAGRQAVEKVLRDSFDVLVLDVRMEGMSGLEAFALMKQEGVEIACLVITGYATEEDSIRAIRLGVGDYLRKPFAMRELLSSLARVSAAFQRRREGRAREQSLQSLADWTSRQVPGANPEAGRIASRLARSLGLDAAACLEVQTAATLVGVIADVAAAPPAVRQALEHHGEHWDGSGPGRLRGEQISLEGRILALALASCQQPRLSELVRQQSGRLDPYLLEHLERSSGDSRLARRLLALARTLLESGDDEASAAALREAEALAPPEPLLLEVALTRVTLAPPAEKFGACRELLARAQKLGPGTHARYQLEVGLLLQAQHPLESIRQVQEALPILADEGQRARAELALWTLGQSPPEWTPDGSLQRLSRGVHERWLSVSLPWLFPRLVRWWKETGALDARLLRSYSSLLPALVQRLAADDKQWLVEQVREQPWAQPLLFEKGSSGTRSLGPPPPLRIRSFGSFEVAVGGERINEKQWRGSRNKYLLAYLATAGSRGVNEDRLVDLFWSEDCEKGKRGLNNTLTNLRKALRPLHWPGAVEYLVRHRAEQIQLNPEIERQHDVEEFEKEISASQGAISRGETDLAREILRRSLPLAAEPFLDGCYMDWAVNQRTVLEQQRLDNLVLLAELDLAAGTPALALEAAQQALTIDDCHQKAYLCAMRALMQQSRPEEAVRVYETAARRLLSELRLEPSLEMFEAYQRARLA